MRLKSRGASTITNFNCYTNPLYNFNFNKMHSNNFDNLLVYKCPYDSSELDLNYFRKLEVENLNNKKIYIR